MIYADFESILVLKDNGKQNLDENYTTRCQKHVFFSCGYQVVWVDDKFSKLLKSYLVEDTVYKFIDSMVEESNCCSGVMKKYFNKELVMTKIDDADFENSTKCCIWDNTFVEGDFKVRDHCDITEKYRGSAHRDYNIKVS